jgi:hypothetical protein
MAHNVTWLCAVGDFENGTFNLPQKPIISTNVQLTTSAPIAQNQCCAYVPTYLAESSFKNEIKIFN